MVTLAPPPSNDTWRDPIRATQHTFRRTLDALAMPGTVQQLIVHPAVSNLSASTQTIWAGSLLLMLLDHEISLAILPASYATELGDLLQRRTRVAVAAPEAAEVVVTDGRQLDPALITSLRRGSLHYPDDSATLVVVVDSLTPETNGTTTFSLSGPGIDGAIVAVLPAMTDEVIAARDIAVEHYPMGIDILILDACGRLLGIPRTTRITRAPYLNESEV